MLYQPLQSSNWTWGTYNGLSGCTARHGDCSFCASTWLGHRMPSYLVKHYFCVCLWVCFCMWIGGLSKVHWCAQSGWTSSNPPKAPKEQKSEAGWILSLCLLSWNTDLLLQWTGARNTGSPGSQAFGLGLDFTPLTFLPRPACRRQIVGLLGLHKHVSQFLPINLIFYIYISIHSIGSVSPENPD